MRIVTVVGLVLLLAVAVQMALGTGAYNLVKRVMPTTTPLEARFAAARLRLEDLPPGWRWGGWRIEEVPGAEARFYWFYGTADPNKTWVNVSQELILYPDPKMAADAYDSWVAECIPPNYRDDWIEPPGLEFTSQADQMTIACLSGYVDTLHHYACNAIGLYGDRVVILRGIVFDDRWLTMSDFQAVLEAMDRRMVAAESGGG